MRKIILTSAISLGLITITPSQLFAQRPIPPPRQCRPFIDPNCPPPYTQRCGNGRVESGEECDDGNRINTDSCTNICRKARCGDRYVQTGVEECDDGNANDNDSCRNNCQRPRCGDGIVDAGDECDDGNTISGDGCSATCHPDCNTHICTGWVKTISGLTGELDSASDIAVDAFGNSYVVGTISIAPGPQQALWIAKYNVCGQEIWAHSYDTTRHSNVVKVGPDGFLYIGGFIRNSDMGIDLWLAKLDPNRNPNPATPPVFVCVVGK